LAEESKHSRSTCRTHAIRRTGIGPSFSSTSLAVKSGRRLQIELIRIRSAVQQSRCHPIRRCAASRLAAAFRQPRSSAQARPMPRVYSGPRLAMTCFALKSGCCFQMARTRACSTSWGTRIRSAHNPSRGAMLATLTEHQQPPIGDGRFSSFSFLAAALNEIGLPCLPGRLSAHSM